MAIKFIEITYEKLNNNKTNNARVEIAVDSAEDLVTAHKGINFTQGSIAWDISTGDFYGLKSTGDWVKQSASDDSDDTTQSEDVQQSNSVSPNNAPQNSLNLNSGLNRPVTLDEPKDITTIPEVEKADTNDSEGVSDDVKEEFEEETEEQTEDIPEEVTEEDPESEEIVEEEIIDDEPTLEEDAPEEIEEEPVIDDISEEQEEEPAEEEGE